MASNVGGLREVVQHDTTGLLVPPGDPNALAVALDKLLDDPKLRKLMGEAGKKRTCHFGVRTAVPHIVEAYEDALRSRS